MDRNFSHFGELYALLVSTQSKTHFLHSREEDTWHTVSKKDFLQTVRHLALAFEKEGYGGRQVAIAIEPSPQWLMLDYALMLSGAVTVPLFTNISEKNLAFELKDADIQTVFVSDEGHADLIRRAKSGVDIRYVHHPSHPSHGFESMVYEGREVDRSDPERFASLLEKIDADDLATIVYTSGTSGLPKGVELTHRNLISQIHATEQNYHFDKEKDIAFSLLPLAHIFERMVMHFYLSQELEVYFADDVKKVGERLKEVNPTVMTVVPRLLEKVFFKMKRKALEGSLPKQLIVRAAFWRATTKDPATAPNLFDKLLDRLVYSKLRTALGSRMRMMISGGAALSDMLYRFYLNIGIGLYQGYGLTESSPVICANTPEANKIGTCGKAFPGVEVKLSEEGELLARGDNIMRGYHNNPEATKEAIDAEGWLHTGDLAKIDEAGYITITGRKKELFKTSTGEYVSSVHIEQKLLERGWFEHAMLIGHGKPFVTALLFVDHDFLGALATKHKSTPRKVLDSGLLHRMTQRLIKNLNRGLNHWERIRDFRIIDKTPTIEEGTLTPSHKLAKEAVASRYADLIQEMYKDHL